MHLFYKACCWFTIVKRFIKSVFKVCWGLYLLWLKTTIARQKSLNLFTNVIFLLHLFYKLVIDLQMLNFSSILFSRCAGVLALWWKCSSKCNLIGSSDLQFIGKQSNILFFTNLNKTGWDYLVFWYKVSVCVDTDWLSFSVASDDHYYTY